MRLPSSPAPLGAAALVLLHGCAPPSGPAVSISAVAPDVACDAGDVAVAVTVTGAGFAPVATNTLREPTLQVPTLTLTRAGDPAGDDDGIDAALLLSPSDGGLRWEDGGTLSFDAWRGMGLVPGAWDLTVTNPDGQRGTLAAGLVWTDPPSVAGLAPDAVCLESAAAPFTIEGAGFLFLGGVGPTVTVGDQVLAASPGDCLPLAGDHDGEICTSITVAIDATTLPLGDTVVTVTNPAPAACPAPTSATLTVQLPPTIGTVAPALTCADGGVITITGERLPEDATVTIGGVPAVSVTWVDDTTIEVVVPEGAPEGDVEVVVSGADGCAASVTVSIVGAPDVFFVDPPTVYDGLSVQVTAWLADVSAEVTEVWIADSAGARTDLVFTWDEADPDRVVATLPAGLAAGEYTFGIVEADGCNAALDGALTITDTLTVAIDALDPGFAWAYDHTPIQVLATSPAPAGEVGFLETPRLYVSPVGGGTTASAIEGVIWRDEGLLTATVPAGLLPGAYDVLVVNPDGTVGVLSAGLVVTEDAPPEITAVSPPGLANTVNETVTIRGANFRNPSVSLTCLEAGVERTVAATVVSSSYTSIDAVVPSNDFGEAICVVEVTNADGTAGRWAALSIRNPAENLFPWSAGTDMVVARRAPVAAAGRTTSVARWVYAVGGDAGDADSALTSIERAPMGVYGTLGEWELLPGTLPAPVTLAGGLVIGEFVYVVGGNDGAGPVATAWRAHVLDPMDVPRLDALSIDDEGALGGGDWTWRVATLYDAADLTNPGGESLAGEPIHVTLPDAGDLSVELSWTPVTGAAGYRVYRSPAADTSGEEWVGDTTTTSFLDTGLPTDPTRVPLPDGALGEWAALPVLLSAREAPCVAYAPDPIPDPRIVHLYAAGGMAADGSALDSVEVLDITIVRDGEHRAGAWTDAGVTLSDARWACGAWTVDSSLHSVVTDDETWVYFGGGETGTRTVGTVDAGRVGAGGLLELWQEVDSMSPARSGFGAASASDFLYAFGGQGGDPSSGGVSGELGYDPMPGVRNWNSLGESLSVERRFAGSAQESAVIVQAGGSTSDAAATRSTDVTNW